MSKDPTQPKAISLLRLSDSERRQVEDYFARESIKRQSAQNMRASPRFRYIPERPTLIDIPTPGGMQQTYLVLPKDLSATGCAILHGAFAYPGTRCSVKLHSLDGQAVLSPGVIVRCQHIVGRVHELGVRFEHGLNLTSFVDIPEDEDLGVAAAGMAPPDEILDTPGLRKLVAEIAAIAGQRECPAALRKKIQDLVKMSDHLEVAGSARASAESEDVKAAA